MLGGHLANIMLERTSARELERHSKRLSAMMSERADGESMHHLRSRKICFENDLIAGCLALRNAPLGMLGESRPACPACPAPRLPPCLPAYLLLLLLLALTPPRTLHASLHTPPMAGESLQELSFGEDGELLNDGGALERALNGESPHAARGLQRGRSSFSSRWGLSREPSTIAGFSERDSPRSRSDSGSSDAAPPAPPPPRFKRWGALRRGTRPTCLPCRSRLP